MFKTLAVSCLFALASMAFASQSDVPENTPKAALENLFNASIAALNKAHQSQNAAFKTQEINSIVYDVILPNINVERGTQFALKKHWDKIDEAGKKIVGDYIVNSLINDYATFLLSYQDFNKLQLIVQDNIQTQDNRALVNITLLENNVPIDVPIAFKMINEQDQWKIYDLLVSGVSLMQSFQASFNSTIRRKGLAHFLNNLQSN